MAEENVQGNPDIVGEGSGGSLSPEIVRQSQEKKASGKGWKPLDQYDGDPADWIDAPEFLARQPLFDRIHDLKNQLKTQSRSFEEDMKVISKQFANMQAQAYKQAKADLEARLELAVEAEDVSAVKQVTKEISELDVAHAQDAAQPKTRKNQSELNETFQAWKAQNEWFDSDIEMQKDAIAIATGHAVAFPDKSQEEVLKVVTEKIKKMYPDKFKSTREKSNMSAVEGGAGLTISQDGSGRRGSKKTISLSDLNSAEQQIARTMIKRGVFRELAKKNNRSEEAEYLAQYTANAESK